MSGIIVENDLKSKEEAKLTARFHEEQTESVRSREIVLWSQKWVKSLL